MPWTLVTGGAKRTGAAICKMLACQGHNVVIHYHTSEDFAEETRQACQKFGVKSATMQGDFSTTEKTQYFIDRYLENFPDTENFIYNVGNYHIQTASTTPISSIKDLYQTNFFAALHLTQALLPSIIDFQGSIVYLGMAGIDHLRADTHSPIYASTKLSLLWCVKSLAKEHGHHQVRINMVSPGIMENAIAIPENISAFIPMNRLGSEEEIARVVAFLTDRNSAYITGQNIEVAGGNRL